MALTTEQIKEQLEALRQSGVKPTVTPTKRTTIWERIKNDPAIVEYRGLEPKQKRARWKSSFKNLGKDYKELGKNVGEGLLSIIRALPRAIIGGGASIGEEISEGIQDRELKPEERELKFGKVGQFFLGKEPVRTLSLQKERTSKFLEEEVGLKTKTAKRAGPPIAIAGLALDLFPPITPKGAFKKEGPELLKQIVKFVSKTDDVAKITPELKTIVKGSDEEVKALATQLKNVSDPNEVETIIREATAKPTPKPEGPKITEEAAGTPEAEILREADASLRPPGLTPPTEESVSAFENAKGVIRESWTKLRETVEDSTIRLKQLERTPGISKIEDLSPWETKQIMSSRIKARITELGERAKAIIKDFDTKGKGAGVNGEEFRKEVNRLLIAEHAPERNLRVGKPKAAGISNDEAKVIVDELKARPYYSQLREAADRMLELNKETLDLLHQDGNKVITDELYNTLRESYKKHVPLQRVMDDKYSEALGLLGRNLDVKSPGFYKAKGSELEVEDILENIVMAHEKAIILTEKNRFGLAMKNFAEANKDLGMFKVIPDSPKIDPSDPRYFGIRVDGKQKWIKVEDPHLASALKGVNVQYMPGVLQFVETFSRIMSQLATRLNPDYLLSGFIRDTQEMLISAGAMKDISAAGALTRIPKSQYSIVKSLRGIEDADTALYKQFLKDGGGGGGMALSTKRDKIKIDLAQSKSNPKKFTEAVLKGFDSANEVFENANRFSVYQEALAKGLSRNRAALMAQEATINFSRKGTAGPIINALYMFANASIQGSAKMLRAMKNPKVAAATLFSVGSAVTLTGQWNDSIDPEWREKISSNARSQNLIVLLPNQDGEELNFIKIPVSWGLRPLKVTADVIYDTATGRETSVGESLEKIGTAVIEGYNPLGGSDIISAVTPTIGDIPIDISRNKTFSGSPIKPDTYGREIPESQRYFRSLQDSVSGRGAIAAAGFLADKAGIEVSPADIDYAFNQIIGGTGRFGSKTVNSIRSISKGETPQSYDIPIVGRFYQSVDEEHAAAAQAKDSDITKFLREQERGKAITSREAANVADEILKTKDNATKRSLLLELAEKDEKAAEKVLDILEEKSLNLTSQDKKIKQLGVENGARAKYVVTKINQMKTNAEKQKYLLDLAEKKVISDKVLDQVLFLLEQE